MRVLRWFLCFPAALALSFVAWAFASAVFTRASYGPALHLKIAGLTPLVIKTAIPAMAFLLTAVVISPNKERRIVFVFFALTLLFSTGGIELLEFASQSDVVFWLSANLGTVLGSLLALAIALRIQNYRKAMRPHQQPAEPSRTTPVLKDCVPRRHGSSESLT